MRVVRKHLLTIFGACGAAALAFFAYEVAGWIGVGVLGLIIAFIAVRLEIEQGGPVGHPRDTGLHTFPDGTRSNDQSRTRGRTVRDRHHAPRL
jgi:hypothetical protein